VQKLLQPLGEFLSFFLPENFNALGALYAIEEYE